jgi:hypothetical protein
MIRLVTFAALLAATDVADAAKQSICVSREAATRNPAIQIPDVEGRKSVLVVSPSGQSILIDTGRGRPVNGSVSNDRIIDAVHAAGLTPIDALVISHFDIDHTGDVAQLASGLPGGHIYDHGDVQTATTGAEDARRRFAPYEAIREKIGHTTVKPGDRIQTKVIGVLAGAAGGKLITKPLPHAGARNPLCGKYQQKDALPGEIEAHLSHDLACPANLLESVRFRRRSGQGSRHRGQRFRQ